MGGFLGPLVQHGFAAFAGLALTFGVVTLVKQSLSPEFWEDNDKTFTPEQHFCGRVVLIGLLSLVLYHLIEKTVAWADAQMSLSVAVLLGIAVELRLTFWPRYRPSRE